MVVLLSCSRSGATGPYPYIPPPDRTFFDQSIELLNVSDHLPGRPSYPFVGSQLTLSVDTLEGDQVTWTRDDSILNQSSDGSLTLTDLQTTETGNYRAIFVRDGIHVTSHPLVINVVAGSTVSPTDPHFSSTGIPGMEALPQVVRPDGWIGVRYLSASLYNRSWYWLSPDGREREELYSIEGPISPEGVVKLFRDGSHLFRHQDNFTLRQSGAPEQAVPAPDGLFANSAYYLKQPDTSWIVGNSINLVGVDTSGEVTFSNNVGDYGVISIQSLMDLGDSSGRFAVMGSVGDTPENYGNHVVLVEADGDTVEGFVPIRFQSHAPTRLPDQTWVHFEQGVLRIFDVSGNLTFETEIPEIAGIDSVGFSPDGWLYAAIRGSGIVRFDLNGDRDHNYAALFPSHISRLGPRLIFDHQNRVLVGVVEAQPSRTDIGKLIRLRTGATPYSSPPVVDRLGYGIPAHHEDWSLIGTAIGTGVIEYQWNRLDKPELAPLPAGPALHILETEADDLGIYQLRVTSPLGTTLSDVIDIRPRHQPRLANISGRGRVNSESTLVAGFVVETRRRQDTPPPDVSAKFLMRGVGPTLADYGVSEPLLDPRLLFENRFSGETEINDDWSALDSNDAFLISTRGIFPLHSSSADAQLLRNLPAGVFTAAIEAKLNTEGIALAEVHSLEFKDTELSNLSLRGRVAAGDNVLIGGFIIEDPDRYERPLKLLVRAIGPTLTDYGVEEVCADPQITLFDSEGNPIAGSDDWNTGNGETIATISSSLGAFALPFDSKDAALLVELAPGAYTAHVSSGDGAGGEALFEIYRLPVE